jgi:hypothetical protein
MGRFSQELENVMSCAVSSSGTVWVGAVVVEFVLTATGFARIGSSVMEVSGPVCDEAPGPRAADQAAVVFVHASPVASSNADEVGVHAGTVTATALAEKPGATSPVGSVHALLVVAVADAPAVKLVA